jgi:ribose transport system substrate-binding protein
LIVLTKNLFNIKNGGKRMRKVIVILFSVLLLALSACSPKEGEKAKPVENSAKGNDSGNSASKGDFSNETYYWISQNSTLPLFVANDYKGLEKAAKELGVKVEKAGPSNIDLPSFISTIEQVCAQKPAGVTVVGWDPSLTAAVNKCIESGVPTVTDDADLPNSKRLSFIGTDWYQIGVEQAKVMIEKTGGKGKVATLSIINADNMKQAKQGFLDTIEGSGLKVVANEDDGGDASKAAEKTAALLSAYPDLAGIAGLDSESGSGIVRALEEAGKAGKIKITAMEQTPEFFKAVRDGKVDAIIVQKRELFTYYAIKTLFEFNHNGLSVLGLESWDGNPIPFSIDTGLLVVEKDNVKEILKGLNVN